MDMMLADNIRRFRKEHSLTQEQLAEVLGVTAGAVYKWEARLSQPELNLIVEMADFFDTSVDVLIGYEMKDNRLDKTVRRLREYRRNKDWVGLAEAEKALKKYPHSFTVVYESAALNSAFGYESGDAGLFRRALELLEQSCLLLPQNEDPEISEQTLYGKMAETYLGLDEADRALELWKTHNAGGLYNQRIGLTLAMRERTEEAVPYLSEAFAQIISNLVSTVSGYVNVYLNCGDYASVQAILQLVIDFFFGLRKEDKPNFLDKVNCALLAALAYAQFMSGLEDAASASLQKAKELAAFFDHSPSYNESDIRFISRIEGASAHDGIGPTAKDAVHNAVDECENEAFSAFWRSIDGQEEDRG